MKAQKTTATATNQKKGGTTIITTEQIIKRLTIATNNKAEYLNKTYSTELNTKPYGKTHTQQVLQYLNKLTPIQRKAIFDAYTTITILEQHYFKEVQNQRNKNKAYGQDPNFHPSELQPVVQPKPIYTHNNPKPITEGETK